jgi:hypothetical protein
LRLAYGFIALYWSKSLPATSGATGIALNWLIDQLRGNARKRKMLLDPATETLTIGALPSSNAVGAVLRSAPTQLPLQENQRPCQTRC